MDLGLPGLAGEVWVVERLTGPGPGPPVRSLVGACAWGAAVLLAGALVATAVRLVLSAQPGADAREVHVFGPGVEAAPLTQPAEGELRVAVAALLSPRRSLSAHGPLLDVLASRLGRPIRVVQRRTYAEVNELLTDGSAQFGFICSGAFVEAEDQGVQLLVAPVVSGARTYHSLIIARSGLQATSLTDLRGHSFAFTDPLSNSGCLYPSALLAERGTPPTSFFSRVLWTGSHEGSIEAVAHGFVDAAAVDDLVYNYLREQEPELVSRTRILLTSPPFGSQPVVASPRVPEALARQVKKILLDLPNERVGRLALESLGIDRFEEARSEDYAPVRAMRATTRSFGHR